MDLKKVMDPITVSPFLSTRKYISEDSCLAPRQFAFRAQILHVGQTKHCGENNYKSFRYQNFNYCCLLVGLVGHYISQVYCDDNKWRSYNDTKVKVISAKEVLSPGETPYVYLYFQLGE